MKMGQRVISTLSFHSHRDEKMFSVPSFLELCCPIHKSVLRMTVLDSHLCCNSGCTFPVIGNIPRFVSADNYAASFGLQWNQFRRTQLDSYTGTCISRHRLTRCLGGALDVLSGRDVLEVGCGAGRFTEVMLQAGARIFACDLSRAVEANYANIGERADYFVCQADLSALPVLPESFDIVVSLGVVQHTPDPEQTIAILCTQVKPGGILVLDHYTYGYATTRSRALLRQFLLRTPADFALHFCRLMVAALWPLHRMLFRFRAHPILRELRRAFLNISPVVDYHDAYLELGPRILHAWAVLDTHDTLTDVYKHLRSKEEVEEQLERCGMVDIEAVYAGNGVEARARKPIGEMAGELGRTGALK